MLNKLFFMTLFFTVVSCSADYSKLSWLDQYREGPAPGRLPATGEEECFIDQFEISQIKEEIPVLEKNFTTKVRLDKKWNFADFKNAETHYIKRFSDYITLNEDAKSCDSLVCIFNSAYGNKEGEEGYRIYHWFLTMGSGISTSRKIPGFADKPEKKLKDYLFPNKELKLLNIMSKTMSKKYRDLLVKTLHRFPNGTSPSAGTAGQYNYSWTSGGSYKKNEGVIFFTDQGVELTNKDKIVHGYYSHVIIHEHTHALDFTYGPHNSSLMISMSKAWTDLSWKWGEVTNTYEVKKADGTTTTEERTEMGWVADDSKSDGFVRNYQRTNPKEDFADTGGLFVTSPEQLKKVSPDKYKWFQKYYKNEGMTMDDFASSQSEKIASKLEQRLWEIVKSCLVDKQNSQQTAQYVKLDHYGFLADSSRQCLESLIEDEINKNFFLVKKNNYYGCYYLDLEKKKMASTIMSKISTPLNDYISKLGEYKDVQKIWANYREELQNSCDPSHIYLKTRKREDAIAAYQQELAECVNGVHAKYVTYGDLFLNEKDIYISSHPYREVKDETLFAFSKMMKGFQTDLIHAAADIVEECSIVKDEELKTNGPVFGSGVYVNSGVLNCINDLFYKQLDEQLHIFMQDKYTLNEEALLLLTEKYSKIFTELINKELDNIHENEQVNVQILFLNEREKTFSTLYSDKIQLGDLYKHRKENNYCLNTVQPLLKKIIDQKWQQLGQYPVTISLNELANSTVEKVCPELMQKANDEFKREYTSVENSIDQFIHNSLDDHPQWVPLLDHEDNFSAICREQNKKNIQNFIESEISTKQDYYFINSDNLTVMTGKKLCQQWEERFNQQLNKIKKQSKTYSTSIKRVLRDNLNWQVVRNKEGYVKSCMLEAQLKVNKDFVAEDQQLKQFDLVSSGLMAKYLAVDACEQLYSEWERNDLSQLSTISTHSDDLMKYLASVNPSSVWQEYMQKFTKDIIFDLADVVKSEYGERVNECKKKYPYVRFSTMKLNRKKCLLEYLEEQKAEDYFSQHKKDNDYHPLIKKAVLETAQKEIEYYKATIDDYLK